MPGTKVQNMEDKCDTRAHFRILSVLGHMEYCPHVGHAWARELYLRGRARCSARSGQFPLRPA